MKYASPSLHHRRTWSVGDLTRSEVMGILETARSLKAATRVGHAVAPLRGKSIALLAAVPPGDTADSLQRAATDLGARVTHLRPNGSGSGLSTLDAAMRLLGRLYDAVDCVGMPAEFVQRLDKATGVPVFNGLSGADHPARAIGELLEIREHAARELAGLCVAFTGPTDTPRSMALLRLADVTGITVEVGPARQHADFEIDAEDPLHWHCSCAGVPIGDGESAQDHRYVLQALLLMTMSA